MRERKTHKSYVDVTLYQLSFHHSYPSTQGSGRNSSATLFGLIVAVLFSVPMLVIGVVYKSQCPAQEWIPRFMIVQGAVACFSIVSVIFLTLMIIKGPETISSYVSMIYIIYNICEMLFTFAWFIAGSVWTFSIKNRVQFINPNDQNYCHKTVYQYAFAVLIIGYIIIFLRCCCQCFISLTH